MEDFKIELDLNNFDVNIEIDINGKENKNPFEKLPVYKIQKTKIKTSLELAKKINLQKNERVICISHGNFIFCDFIVSLIQEKKYEADEVIISTLSLNSNNLAALEWAMDYGFIKNLKLIISDFWYQTNKHKFIPQMLKIMNKFEDRFSLSVCRSHTKICLIKTNGLFITIHGSANLTSSNNLEQFMIEEGEQLYKFMFDFQQTIINNFQLTKKSANRNELFNLI